MKVLERLKAPLEFITASLPYCVGSALMASVVWLILSLSGVPWGIGLVICGSYVALWVWTLLIAAALMPFAVGWVQARDKKTEARCRELEAQLQELLASEVSEDEERGERWTK